MNFEPANNGLSSSKSFTDIAVSQQDSNIVFLMAHESKLNPFYSENGAKTWHASSNTNLEKLLYKSGFWFSAPFAPHPTMAFTALTASNGRDRIYKTLDGGKTWAYSGNGFIGGRMRDIAFSSNGAILFCLTDFGLWLTEDDCRTFWELDVGRIFGAQSSYWSYKWHFNCSVIRQVGY